jgi:malonyl-CoA/methylmalonyl-CoA synthetase
MIDNFDAAKVWRELLSTEKARPNVIMGVPSVYVKLIEEIEKSYANTDSKADFAKAICKEKMRVMISGSASLPVPVLEQWESITTHRLLERYGMTEIGMALTNPLHGERKPGFVGLPFQSVRAKVVEMTSREKYTTLGKWQGKEMVGEQKDGITGDLLIKGPSVFKEYWKNPEATKKEFTHDGWFITGDTVEFVNGSFKIMGRNSVDIIKSGGYKLSALEIETQLLGLKEIKDVSVVALPDSTWGQKVAAMIVWNGRELNLNELRELAKTRLPAYACPTVIKTIDELPRNQLGKVNKKELVKSFQ